MACRKPVVSTDLSTGVPWVNQHGKTGYCVEPRNPRELACAVERLLANRELREEMGAAARARRAAIQLDTNGGSDAARI
jgi:glycosyltransferase involved in cell wall biosynthesis